MSPISLDMAVMERKNWVALKDLLDKGLTLVICGTAAGRESAKLKQYYAGRGNKLWRVLYETGLTPDLLGPAEYEKLLEYGIGFTDLVKKKAGQDNILLPGDFDSRGLRERISRYHPKYLCFNGKRAAQEYFGNPVEYGLQQATIGHTRIFVAPSTSAAAGRFWDKRHWEKLARLCKRADREKT